jgi:hypothetical protein
MGLAQTLTKLAEGCGLDLLVESFLTHRRIVKPTFFESEERVLVCMTDDTVIASDPNSSRKERKEAHGIVWMAGTSELRRRSNVFAYLDADRQRYRGCVGVDLHRLLRGVCQSPVPPPLEPGAAAARQVLRPRRPALELPDKRCQRQGVGQ